MDQGAHYREPGRLTRSLMNPFVIMMMRLGISVWGSRILEVRGRQSGMARRTPVNLLEFDGHQYLVSPRGRGNGSEMFALTKVDSYCCSDAVAMSGSHRRCRTVRSHRYSGHTSANGRWKWASSSTE